MAYQDVTLEFQKLVQDKQQAIPPNKRRRISRPLSNEVERTGHKISKEYVEEAYQIVSACMFPNVYLYSSQSTSSSHI
jgi:hypothetical protein